MTLVGALAGWTGLPLLLAPFGATAVLVFGQPQSPFSQPANVFGGYLTGAAISVLVLAVFPAEWWAATVTVGLVIGVMPLLRVTHPPAGAVPLVAFTTHMPADTLFFVVLAGAMCLVGIGVVHHRLPPRIVYPRPLPEQAAE